MQISPAELCSTISSVSTYEELTLDQKVQIN